MTPASENFFSRLGFDAHKDLVKENSLFKGQQIEDKLADRVYYYEAPDHTNTSFYFFDSPDLTPAEKKEIHCRIWNENKVDMHLWPTGAGDIEIFYSRTNPKKERLNLLIDRGEDILKRINKWSFDSGTFWLNYGKILDKIKRTKRTVDIELIRTLTDLRKELIKEYTSNGIDGVQPNEIIQALIDRTLFIKFLEDRHIINSYFYKHFFDDESLTYKGLLKEKNRDYINKLFKEINKIFNNELFASPEIPVTHLTNGALESICRTIEGYDFRTKQLSLFDFQFDIIPIEFIGQIYQIFLEDKQAKEGIYYTPEGLAKFIVDSVIGETIGKTIDPSCGSGVFLVMAFRRLLKNAGIKDLPPLELIDKRSRLLADNIFGIEKDDTARRLTIFSLYLEVLNGIKPGQLKAVIKEQIETTGECKLPMHDFQCNIKSANTLETLDSKKVFKNMKFDFIVGNPPWKEIQADDDEHGFWEQNKEFISGKQLSQCFVVKAEDWMKKDTRCGLVLNSASFYNETDNFQSYFFSNFTIESFYDLSGLKSILFKSAAEPASVVIYSNSEKKENHIAYYTIEMNDFTRIFERVIIKTGDEVLIPQDELISGKVKLRDYLLGKPEDIRFLEEFSGPRWKKLEANLARDKKRDKKDKPFIHEGLTFVSSNAICKKFEIAEKDWHKMTNKEKDRYKADFKNLLSRSKPSNGFDIPYLKPENISKYKIQSYDSYMGADRSDFERGRGDEVFSGERILCTRVGGKLKAVYIKENVYCSSDIFVLKMGDSKSYYFFQALLNSDLVEYYLSIKARKRIGGSYPKINAADLPGIPFPKYPDEKIMQEINRLSEMISCGEETDPSIEKKIQDNIYKLYGLNILQRNRIDDFFIDKNETVEERHIEE
ncbi:MAG TPA: N-6 DNA methylase [Candidatus Kapabacteria bacterium]|nr:N-6 DNA methylase [Candidatus Kapabacteria bacterium]